MITPAFIFTDHAVLQCGKAVKIWGQCSSEKLEVRFADISVCATVSNGHFTAVLPPMKAGLRGELSFTSDDGETLVLSDVVTGEVWIAGGQSNMEHPTFCTLYDEDELRNCDDVRFFTVPRRTCYGGETHGFHFIEIKAHETPWELCSKETAAEFTAVGCFFALKLQKELNIPIGIISCNWGATLAQNWVDEKYLERSPLTAALLENDNSLPKKDAPDVLAAHIEYQQKMKEFCQNNDARALVDEVGVEKFLRICGPQFACGEPENYSRRVSVLRHSMLDRIIPYTAHGVIWYQGESNALPAPMAKERYKAIFSALMSDWRDSFAAPSLPFYTVQLAAYPSVGADKTNWAQIRAAQWELMNEDDRYYSVMAYDIGEKDNIHPAKKQVIGYRLADAALSNEYGLEKPWLSPSPVSCERSCSEVTLTYGDDIRLTYKGESPTGIYVKYEDGSELEAEASINGNKIRITLPASDKKAIEINQAHRNYSVCSITTSDGLPLASFALELK